MVSGESSDAVGGEGRERPSNGRRADLPTACVILTRGSDSHISGKQEPAGRRGGLLSHHFSVSGVPPNSPRVKKLSAGYISDMLPLKYNSMSDTKQSQIRRRNDPRNRPALRKSERTRQAILDAALTFLWTHPFRDLTVAELMSLAGTSRSAFYQYFEDLHGLMETLLQAIEEDILDVTTPWLQGEGDPLPLLAESMEGLVRVCYQQGPILRAVSDAAPMDERLEKAWTDFLKDFDDAVTQRIEQHQKAGLIQPFDAHPIAIALNRMDAYLLIHHFGRRPRGNRKSVQEAILRVWTSTLYGDQALADPVSGRRAKRAKTSRSKTA